MPKPSRRPNRVTRAANRKKQNRKERDARRLQTVLDREPIWDHQLKLRRADEFLESVRQVTHEWLASKPYVETREMDRSHGELVVYVEFTKAPPRQVSVLIGDCLHALRSALDHVVYELSEVHFGGELPAEIAGRCEFPIAVKPLSTRAKTKIGGLPNEAQNALIAMLPEREDLTPDRGLPHPLWLLHELERLDKHRRLHLVVASQDGVGLGFPNKPGFSLASVTFSVQAILEGKTEIARYSLDGGLALPIFPSSRLLSAKDHRS